LEIPALAQVEAGQQARPGNGRYGKQQGKARGLRPLETEEAGGGHSDAGAASAGDQCQDLGEADD
jgi:hypothetical protein